MRQAINISTIMLAPIALAIALYGTFAGLYAAALVAIVIAVLLMEARVRFGFRLPRGPLFGIHLACGILLLISLAILVYAPALLWLARVADVLVVVVALLGSTLLARHVSAFLGAGGETRTLTTF